MANLEKNIIFPYGITGESITFRIQKVKDNTWLDNADGVFRVTPSDYDTPATEYNSGVYLLNEARSAWNESQKDEFLVLAYSSGSLVGFGNFIVANDQGTCIINIISAISAETVIVSGGIDLNASSDIYFGTIIAENAAFTTASNFGFTAKNIIVSNDDTSLSVDFSFDGITVHGTLLSGEGVSLTSKSATKIYIKDTAGTASTRVWAW